MTTAVFKCVITTTACILIAALEDICTLIRHLTSRPQLPPHTDLHLIKLKKTCDKSKEHMLFVLRWCQLEMFA